MKLHDEDKQIENAIERLNGYYQAIHLGEKVDMPECKLCDLADRNNTGCFDCIASPMECKGETDK